MSRPETIARRRCIHSMRVAVSSDGTAVLQSDAAYQLQVLDQTGAVVRTLSRPLPPQQVTPAIREAWLQDWSRERVSIGASAELPYDPPFAEVMSQVTGLRADRREVLVTRMLDAEPDYRSVLPTPSYAPLLLAVSATVASGSIEMQRILLARSLLKGGAKS